MSDGSVYSGWRAVLWAPLVLPLALYAFLYWMVLMIARMVMRRDEVLGWRFDDDRTWRRHD